MSNTKAIRVDNSLVDVFGRVSNGFADSVKKQFNLKELFVSDVLASQLVAGKMNGQSSFNFRVRKTGLNKGILELA